MTSVRFNMGKELAEASSMAEAEGITEGDRRSNGVIPSAPNSNGMIELLTPDPEVKAKKTRRKFTVAYKLRILEETDACTELGEIGKILRREGLYFSHLCIWRKQRRRGILQGISPKKRGRKYKEKNPLSDEIAELQKEKARLEKELKRSTLIIEAQKKISEILGISDNREARKL